MELTGKVIAILPAREGVSASTGNKWKTQEYVIETEDRYPKKTVFEIFGEDKIKQSETLLQVGNAVTVSFDIDAREWNGRWFNSVRAWKVVPYGAAAPQPAVQQPEMFPPVPQEPNDNLPF